MIREKARVFPLEENMREAKLRWFGHVKMMSVNTQVRRCEVINLMHCTRERGRQNRSWNEVIKGDLKFVGLKLDMA